MHHPTTTGPTGRLPDFAPVWLAELERALSCGDFEAAAAADRELRRLGVRVTFPRPSVPNHHTRARHAPEAPDAAAS